MLNPNDGAPVILIVQVAVLALSSICNVFLHCLVSTVEPVVGVGVFGVAVGFCVLVGKDDDVGLGLATKCGLGFTAGLVAFL